ncbi:endonuclease/exonuclease/phosphatase family protein [Nocardia yamanashiensis]|uniref:endonuclease/exonuclease/phosphatase family protein n=1 Tax=Nocardia yamanashiensis TaxID=209247 RepID=UPI000AD26DC7|nr:endonuclease/exonuclease/phosphatase family protein [Nocardia yamanashiensis]
MIGRDVALTCIRFTQRLTHGIASGARAAAGPGTGSFATASKDAAERFRKVDKSFHLDSVVARDPAHSSPPDITLGKQLSSETAGGDPRRPFRVVTWNIAGGRRSLSTGAFDYSEVDLPYFAEKLRRLNPDVINVQESEIGPDGSTARTLAELLGYSHVYETKMCPSHISEGKDLGLAVLSRLPIEGAQAQRLPTTRLDLKVRGVSVEPYDRYAQRVNVAGINVVNLHPTPLGFFGHSYEEGAGAEHAREIGTAVRGMVEGPAVVAADLNTDRPGLVYGSTFEDLGMSAALEPDARTVPGWDGAPDQIYSSRDFQTVNQGVETTDTDHHLVWADLEVSDPQALDTLAAAREAIA